MRVLVGRNGEEVRGVGCRYRRLIGLSVLDMTCVTFALFTLYVRMYSY